MDLLTKVPMEYEPLRQNRFLIRFPSDLGISSFYVTKATFPGFKQNSTAIPFLNTQNYVIGKYEWSSFSITFNQYIGPSSTQALMEWLRLHTESVSGRQGYAASYKRDLILEQLDPTGVAITQWIIIEAMITNFKVSDLDYSTDAISTITVDLQPYYCIHSF